MSEEVETLITSTRPSTHGSFADNARISQSIKKIMRQEAGWEQLNDEQKEALEMVSLKISRILSGNPYEPDHWLDVQGYAGLAKKSIDIEQKA